MEPSFTKTWKLNYFGWAAFALIIVSLTTAGCTQNAPYRVPEDPDSQKSWSINTTISDLVGDPSHRDMVEKHCIELHEGFDLAFVEFDDQGQLWSSRQVSELQNTILASTKREDTEGVLLVTFVHGWKHNASVCDENVACLREILVTLYNMEQLNALRYRKKPRRVIGVYVGWRGLSVTPKLLKEGSFWARKAAAHRVGEGQLLEILVRLEHLRDVINNSSSSGDSRLIVVGHSFGGAVVYSAVSQVLLERLSSAALNDQGNINQADSTLVDGFGDLVVLVNPAFEATLYASIQRVAQSKRDYSTKQPAVLVTASSDTDSATKKAFPIGRFLSTLFESTRDDEQTKALRTTLGNYKRYRTHRAEPIIAKGDAPPFIIDDLSENDEQLVKGVSDCKCSYIDATIKTSSDLDPWGELADKGLPTKPRDGNQGEFGGVYLRSSSDQVHDYNPFLVISTTDQIITQHNGIYNTLFINFLRDLLLTMEERKRGQSVDADEF